MGVRQIQAKLWKGTVTTCERFGRWIASEKPGKHRLGVFICIGVVLLVVGCVGIIEFSTKSGLSELYIDEGSRMFDEFDKVKGVFGGLSRTQSIIVTEENLGSVIKKEGLDSYLDMLIPMIKKDESAYCAKWDGFATSRPAECDQFPDSLYCNCEEVAGNPKMITIDAVGTDANGNERIQKLDFNDLCEAPAVQPLLRASKLASLKVTDPGSDTSPTFLGLYQKTLTEELAESNQALGGNMVDLSSDLAAAKTTCINAFKSTMANGWDAVGAATQCGGALVVTVFGPAKGCTILPGDGSYCGKFGQVFGAVAQNPDISQQDIGIAVATAFAGTPDVPTATVITFSLLAHINAVVTATTKAFVSQESVFLSEGNVLSYGYRELAQCIADYTEANRATIQAQMFGAATTGLNPTAAAAAKGVIDANPNVDPSTSVSLQQQIAGTYFATVLSSASGEPYATTLANIVANDLGGNNLDTSGEAALRGIGVNAFITGVALDSTAVRDQMLAAYPSNGAVTPAQATTAVLTALGATAATLPTVTRAVIIGGSVFPGHLMPASVTLGGVLAPLPNTWGVDRFPCTRGTPLDGFREGDFDYPYALKQAEQVGKGVFYWFNNPVLAAGHVAAADCMNKAFAQPVKRGVYFGTLINSDYNAGNLNALAAGETAFLTQLGQGANSTVAAQAGLQAFLSNNGTTVVNNLRQSPLQVPSWMGSEEGQKILSNIATAIATAAGTARSVTEGLRSSSGATDVITLLYAFGYWWRPSYGSHWTSKAVMPDEEIKLTVQDAILNVDDQSIGRSECVQHNTDPVGLTGRFLRTCHTTWSVTKSPHEIAFGDSVWNGTTLLKMRASRWAGTTWNEDHPNFIEKFDALMYRDGTKSSSDYRADVLDKLEAALIDFMTPIWKKEAGTKFADGEVYGNLVPTFLMDRSTADAVDSISDTNSGIYVGAVLAIIFYAGATLSNFRDAVHSHILLSVWGVAVICLSTLASFGYSAWFGLDLTSLNTVVVPFVSLGIGVDDMFVLAQSYAMRGEQYSYGKGIMAAVLGEALPSVTFTSLTNSLAFFVATATPVFIVRVFCLQMGISVVLNWLAIIFLFLPAMVYDARRTAKGQPEPLVKPCSSSSGSTQKEPKSEEKRHLVRFATEYYGPLLTKNWFKALTLIIFGIFFGLMLWQGVWEHEIGLRRSDAAPEDGYVYDYAIQLEEKFTLYSAATYHFSDDLPAAQENMLKAARELQKSPWLVENLQIASTYWLTNFLSSTTGNASQPFPYTNPDQFYKALGDWLRAVGAPFVADLHCINKDTREVKDCFGLIGAFDVPPASGSDRNIIVDSARTPFYMKDHLVDDDFVQAIRDTRAVVDPVTAEYAEEDPSYEGFVWGYTYLFWEQYLNIEENLYFIVGMALIGVFAATFIFQFSVETSFILCVVILMCDIELYGLMNVMGIKLNGFSLANLCVAIGMAVEFTAHLAHEFLATAGESRNDRMVSSLGVMFRPMFHGMLTSTIATCFIAANDVGFVQQYYFGMFLAMIWVAFLNGMWLLPVILSLIGPASMDNSGGLPSREGSAGAERYQMDDEPLEKEQPNTYVAKPGPAGDSWVVPQSQKDALGKEDPQAEMDRRTSYLEVVSDPV